MITQYRMLPLILIFKIPSLSAESQQPQSLQQFIETTIAKYETQKRIQTANEYVALITPYVNQIIELEKQLKEAQSKLSKKEEPVKINKNKK